MEMEKQVTFKNWTAKDFTCTFDAKESTFEAGASYIVPLSMANFFATKLAIREMMTGSEADQALPEAKFKELFGKALPNTPVAQLMDKVEVQTFPKAEPIASEAPETATAVNQQAEQAKNEPDGIVPPQEGVKEGEVEGQYE
jgi:hypothetical protein